MTVNKRALLPNEVNEIYSYRPEDITLTKMKELFANHKDNPARFNTNDTFLMPKDKFFNSEKINTTVGRYIYNLVVLSPVLIKYTGYINEPVDSKKMDKIEEILSLCLLNDKITVKDFIGYIDRSQWLGYSCSTFLCAGYSYDIVKPLDSVVKRKKELEKQYSKEIEAGDPAVSSKMETELLDIAEKEVSNLESFDYYKSGTTKGFNNNYKNTSIMRGAIADNDQKGKFTISTSNLHDGISKKDYHAFADMPVQASYSRAIETQKGGYIYKQLSAAFQTIVIDELGSDCGSLITNKVLITNNNKEKFLFRYIKVGNSLIMLDEVTIEKYIGKYVNMRSPMYCKNKKICSKCIGEESYKMGIKNIGLTSTRVGSKFMNASLKKFHNTTIKYSNIDIDKYIE